MDVAESQRSTAWEEQQWQEALADFLENDGRRAEFLSDCQADSQNWPVDQSVLDTMGSPDSLSLFLDAPNPSTQTPNGYS